MLKVRMRGIYSTALTKLLIDEGFEIVQPSTVIGERFNLDGSSALKPFDIDIFDRSDRQGIYALCSNGSANLLIDSLLKRLPDVIVRKCKYQIGGIYKGLVKHFDLSGKLLLVQIDDSLVGILSSSRPIGRNVKEMLVQIEKDTLHAGKIILTDNIKIIGEYAILIREDAVKISRRIKDSEIRAFLKSFGLEVKPKGWGIVWRSAAATASKDELKREISLLLEKWRRLVEMASRAKAPTLLLKGKTLLNIEFPYGSKMVLDDIRGKITPTIPGHHYYKAFSRELSSSVDMAENLLGKGYRKEEVLKSFKQIVQAYLPSKGQMLRILHVKLDGRCLNLGRAELTFFNSFTGAFKLKRIIRSQGVYDGLEVERSCGDVAITNGRVGECFLETLYFSSRGEFKGAYININTPIEIYPKQVRYVDLEVDVCVLNNGNIRVLDEEKLVEALEKGIISNILFRKVKFKVEQVLKNIVPKILDSYCAG